METILKIMVIRYSSSDLQWGYIFAVKIPISPDLSLKLHFLLNQSKLASVLSDSQGTLLLPNRSPRWAPVS